MKNTLKVLLASLLLATSAAASAAPKGEVLVLLSSETALTLKEGKTLTSGYYLNELGVPAAALLAPAAHAADPWPTKPIQLVIPYPPGGSADLLGRPLAVWERLLAMAAAFTLIAALPLTDEVGFALSAVFAARLWLRQRPSAA